MKARLPTWVAVVVILGGCGPSDPPFPDGFLFGSAVSGFQVDMGCPTLPPEQCEDRRSDWYAFITSPDLPQRSYMSGDAPSTGPGHWELYEKDYQRAADELHHNAFRSSIEWSRVFPTPTDGVEGYEALRAIADGGALAHYRQMLTAQREKGLRPLVTLNHYTLPSWLHDTVACHKDLTQCSHRGWLDRERTVREIAKYAGFVAREFGDLVDVWATLNEPFAVVLPGYLTPGTERANPPGVNLRFEEARTALLAMIEAHARMYDQVKANDGVDADADGQASQIGLVYAITPTRPKKPESKVDQRGADNLFYLYNTVFLDAAIRGQLDEQLDGNPVFREDLAGRMDYLGINYYTRVTVEGLGTAAFPQLSPLSNFNPLTLEVWEDYPRGIYEAAMLAQSYGLPSYVTENGTFNTEGAPRFLVRHLSWLKRAIDEGAQVRGYFFWSLIDNYEWNHGMNMQFGLYAVDKSDPAKTRVARPTVATYAAIAQARRIPPELATQYPVEE